MTQPKTLDDIMVTNTLLREAVTTLLKELYEHLNGRYGDHPVYLSAHELDPVRDALAEASATSISYCAGVQSDTVDTGSLKREVCRRIDSSYEARRKPPS